MAAPMTVMIAVDGSTHADNAVEWYLAHIHTPGNQVVLAHVTDPGVSPSFAFRAGLAVPYDEWNAMLQDAEQKKLALKRKHTDRLHKAGVEKVSFISEQGRPETHLVQMAAHSSASLVVMGTRGMGAVRRTVLGSVSDYVLHHLDIPVAICRHTENAPKQPEQEVKDIHL